MMEQTPQPRQRRAARYSENTPPQRLDGANPPAQAAEAVRSRRAAQHTPAEEAPATAAQRLARVAPAQAEDNPPPVERRSAPKPPVPQPKPTRAMPRWLNISLVCLLLACMGLLAANQLMSAYLTRAEQQREAAYQRVVAAHPVVYRDWIEQYAAQYNLQPAFVAAIILNESSFDPMAESNVGARGLMQLMEDTAGWIAGKVDEPGYSFSRMWDPECNIKFGCWYLNYLAQLFGGDPVSVASAYHAGQGTVRGWLQNSAYTQDGQSLLLDAMPEGPTRTYAGRVTRAYGIYDKLYWQAFNPVEEEADEV